MFTSFLKKAVIPVNTIKEYWEVEILLHSVLTFIFEPIIKFALSTIQVSRSWILRLRSVEIWRRLAWYMGTKVLEETAALNLA